MATLEELNAELDALKAAWRSGVREITYDGKRTVYDDEAGLRRRIKTLEGEIAGASGTSSRPVAGRATFRRS